MAYLNRWMLIVIGSCAVLAAWLARQRSGSEEIRTAIEHRFGYDLGHSVDDIRKRYGFDISCKGTVPPAIVCALEAADFEDAIRNAISRGGDADTMACITGGIAEVLFGLPGDIAAEARGRLDPQLRQQVERFYGLIAERGRG